MPKQTVTYEELLECLERSGYLLESRIVRDLDARGFFVDPNQVMKDPVTGKSREIDFVAESSNRSPDNLNDRVKTYFIGEVVNNQLPIVLLTSKPFSPNTEYQDHIKFACTPESPPFVGTIVEMLNLKAIPKGMLFTQYCALTNKKGSSGELMASHPDDLYSSLKKLAEYTAENINHFKSWATKTTLDIWRVFFWHPMLIVGGPLFVVDVNDDNVPNVSNANSAFLEFNWHRGDIRETTAIEVVQLESLYDRLDSIVKLDQSLEAKIHEIRTRTYGQQSSEI